MITSIACLQLVEKGQLAIDDPSIIEKHLPELWAQPVLTGFTEDNKPITKPRNKPITLRNLLTHTSGLAYNFTSDLIAKWEVVSGNPSWISKNATVEALTQPTVIEPGTGFVYGISIDWAGMLFMRVSGQTLEDYFHENIFGPSGVARSEISFFHTDSIRERLMATCVYGPDGKLYPHAGMRDNKNWTPEDLGIQLGGAGLIGTPKAYMAVLRQILRARDGNSTVISKFVYDNLFTPALPPREDGNTCRPDLGVLLQRLGTLEEQFTSGDNIDHSLGLCLYTAESEYGAKAGTASWGGVAHTRFWVDPTTGIAGFYGTQLLDMNERKAFGKNFSQYQRTVYDSL
jgi:CubicO group peptidase (beta-lactamase class C family)